MTAIFLTIAVCLATCFQVAVVPTASMQGTILVGDHLFVSKALDGPSLPWTSWRLPRLRSPKRGDIVSFRAPGQQDAVYLKRVVALPGDSVEMRQGVLYVNDVAELNASPCKYRSELHRQVVPRDSLFVMGDNRDNSEDSRTFGPVPSDSVIGHPLLVLWSIRTRSSDWLDEHGHETNRIYWAAISHLISSTRWSRTGALL